MGVINRSKGRSKSISLGVNRSPSTGHEARQQSRRIWEQVFSDKERTTSTSNRPVRGDGGSHGRTLLATDASFMRLLQAMRSMAPGTWSDDRWEQTKHFKSIQYVCIHRIGEQASQAEFQVYQRDRTTPEGKREIPPDHVLIDLLQKPNPQDSFGDVLYRMIQQLMLTGQSLTWMVPNRLGYPMELYPIPTAIAIPQPTVNPDYPDGYYRIQPIYPYGPFSSHPTPATAVGAPIPAQWMLRSLLPHPLLRYDGYSPLTGLNLHIDQVEAIDRSRFYSMRGSVSPSAVLQLDEVEGADVMRKAEIERIRADFEATHQSPENVGKLYVAAPGSRLEPWGMAPAEMDYVAGWDQLVDFLMAGFGISKTATGMIESASYSTLFATLKQFYLLTLQPMLDRIARDLTRHLAPFFGDDLIIEITGKRIDDHDLRNAELDILIGAGCITKGELRQSLGRPRFGDERDDEIVGEMPAQPGEDPRLEGPVDGRGTNPNETVDGTDQGDTDFLTGLFEETPFEDGRPRPGPDGLGAMGPRKDLLAQTKSINGNGNGHYSLKDRIDPRITVNVPRQPAPVVHVHVPDRKVRKKILYNQYGQPEEIHEEDVSDRSRK